MDDERKIVLNRIQCVHCKDIIMSRDVHEYVQCKCGKVAVDGGHIYLKRAFTNPDDYIEMSLFDDSPFEEIRKVFTWGTFGKFSDEPMRYVKLCEMTNNHINAILRNRKQGASFARELFVKELKYRADHKIFLED